MHAAVVVILQGEKKERRGVNGDLSWTHRDLTTKKCKLKKNSGEILFLSFLASNHVYQMADCLEVPKRLP